MLNKIFNFLTKKNFKKNLRCPIRLNWLIFKSKKALVTSKHRKVDAAA